MEMSKGYTVKRSHVPEVSRGASESSSPGSQQSQNGNGRQTMQAQKNIVRGGCSKNIDNGKVPMRPLKSPFCSLSPPQSSSSSELLSNSSFDFHYESDAYRSEITSYPQDIIAENYSNQASQRADLSSIESPDSTLAFSGNNSNAMDIFPLPSNEEAVSESEIMFHKLHALETALMSPDADGSDLGEVAIERTGSWGKFLDDISQESQWGLDSPDSCAQNSARDETQHEKKVTTALEHGPASFEDLLGTLNLGTGVKNLLITCAAALAEEKMDVAEVAMQNVRKLASVYGEPLERLAAYMSEGLVARLHASGSIIYKALKCREAPAIEVLSAMQKLYEICPYIQFAFVAANGAIAEAFTDESLVHVFDFQIDQGTQWFSLINALASRPGGPPSLRITTVDDPTAHSYPLGGLDAVKTNLARFAARVGVPFEFVAISSKLSELQATMIERKPGEALAINFSLQLHHMPDESVRLDNPRDRIIRMCKSLSPKVLTLVEQDANTNTAPFLARFVETLNFYFAVFDSIDVALPRDSKDRVNVEEHCLARDIVNVIACEGVERVERHELAGKWRARMLMAGFKPHPLSVHVNSAIKSLLDSYNKHYSLKEDKEILLLGWKDRFLLAASAWH